MLEQRQHEQLPAAVQTALLSKMLAAAGSKNHLAAAQWLRAQGAAWPAILQHRLGDVQQQWQGVALDWARAEGCTSPVEQ
jgi:hypothetical protein